MYCQEPGSEVPHYIVNWCISAAYPLYIPKVSRQKLKLVMQQLHTTKRFIGLPGVFT